MCNFELILFSASLRYSQLQVRSTAGIIAVNSAGSLLIIFMGLPFFSLVMKSINFQISMELATVKSYIT